LIKILILIYLLLLIGKKLKTHFLSFKSETETCKD